MTKNSDNVDKYLQAQADTEPHQTPSGNISLTQRENDTPEQPNKEMEVHHNPKMEKKNLKEYLLDGLMIFIAVTLGFFAESLREHLGDKAKEKKYVSSLTRELKNDTLQYGKSLNTIIFFKLIA